MILRRTHYLNEGVFGELYTDEDGFLCFTLERSYGGEPKLPLGTYALRFEFSPRFGQYLWELKGVPNATEIKFHVGNTQKDSDGCILVGLIQNLNSFDLLSSRQALNKLHGYLKGRTEATLIVENALKAG